ncbi:MAG TPA: energy transducer TonB [Candidatus Eisenbacteria bacterium]|nr:energy transducer TonB [Candidatus Eisenbacteria bacterium]
MRPYNPLLDMSESHTRARRTMAASLVLHLLLIAWIVLHPVADQTLPAITEIAYLEPGDLDQGSAASGPPAAAPRSAPGLMTSNTEDSRFEREKVPADIAPDPQSPSATEDRLRTRLAALQRDALVPAAGPGVSPTMTPAWGAAGVPGAIGGDGHGPMNLARGGSGSGTSLELTRGGSGGHAVSPALAATGLPAADRPEAAAPSHGEETARRQLAGASLAGPIADRAILQMTPPVYPDWAKKEAVEGSVTLYFVVRPDGSVKENVLVQKTAGFQDFDENARTALRTWRFEALRAGRTGEQWGTITFHFRLRDSG